MPPFATGVFFLPSIGTRERMVAGMAGRDPALYQEMLADIRELSIVADDLGYDAVAFTVTAVPATSKACIRPAATSVAFPISTNMTSPRALSGAGPAYARWRPRSVSARFLKDQGIATEQLVSMFPIGRMGRPEELVAAVRYLCSDDARYVTGAMDVLDGGHTAQ